MFSCVTLNHSDQTIWAAHLQRGATQVTGSGKRLSRTMVWTMVALRSDQKSKFGNRTKVAQQRLVARKSHNFVGRTIVWFDLGRMIFLSEVF